MIVKIPKQFIDQKNTGNSIREYYINPHNISFVDVSKFSHYEEEVQCNVMIQMSSGLSPMLKQMSIVELDDFIMWWNRSLNFEKLSIDTFTDKEK